MVQKETIIQKWYKKEIIKKGTKRDHKKERQNPNLPEAKMATSKDLFRDHVLYKTLMESVEQLRASGDLTKQECANLIYAFKKSTSTLMNKTETYATLETGVVTNHREVDNYHELTLVNVNINVGTQTKIRCEQLMIKGEIKSDS